MKVFLEINDKVSCNFDKKKLELAVEKTIKNSGLSDLSHKEITVGFGFVSLGEMQGINKRYRSEDSPTDVLSFANYDEQKDVLSEEKDNIFLGDLIICCEDIAKHVYKKDILMEEEVVRVVSHGTLHLLGFSHGREMFRIQEMIVDRLRED